MHTHQIYIYWVYTSEYIKYIPEIRIHIYEYTHTLILKSFSPPTLRITAITLEQQTHPGMVIQGF